MDEVKKDVTVGSSLSFEVKTEVTGTLTRRKVRNLLLRLRSNLALDPNEMALAQGIKKIVDEQIQGHYTLDDFTFQWDIHPSEPLKVITPFQWKDCGGRNDPVTGAKTPPAFTRQEK